MSYFIEFTIILDEFMPKVYYYSIISRWYYV